MAAKKRRLGEIYALLSKNAVDHRSRIALLSAYLSTLRTITSKREVRFLLHVKSAVYPFRMRQSDIFVLEEVLLEEPYALESSVGPGPTIVDAGANIGVTALWFLACYPGARLYAFEPEPANCRLLRANVGAIDGISVEELAVGDTTSTKMLHRATHGALHSTKAEPLDQADSLPVQCVRLDDYLAARGIDRVDVLKVDVEGSALDLLKGLGDRLDSVHVIVGEMHETLVDEGQFYRFLEDRGFRRVRRRYYGTGKAQGVHVFEVAR